MFKKVLFSFLNNRATKIGLFHFYLTVYKNNSLKFSNYSKFNNDKSKNQSNLLFISWSKLYFLYLRSFCIKYLWFYKKIHVSYIGLPTLSTLPTLCSISMLWKNCGKHNKTNKADVYLLKMNSKVKKIKKQKKELDINFLNAKIFKSNYICYSLFHVKEQFVRYISNVSNVIYC